ncbi:MAG: tetratricopeptide repeat protein [Chloroherpetonaceae bacterium]|nr:tetratricopeptide repeat protein [Chloroherpetonaceae bacterium]
MTRSSPVLRRPNLLRKNTYHLFQICFAVLVGLFLLLSPLAVAAWSISYPPATQTLPTDSLTVATLCDLAEEYRTHNADSAHHFIQQAAAIAEKLGSKSLLLRIFKVKGDLARDQGSHADAISLYNHALSLAKEIRDTAKLAILYNNLALVYSRLSEYPTALDYHFQSLRIKEQRKDTLGIANSLSNIGLIYKKQGEYTEALRMYDSARRIFQALGHLRGLSAVFNNIGAIYRLQEQYDSALFYYTRSLEFERQSAKYPDIATNLVNIADVYLQTNHLSDARRSAEEAIMLYQKANDRSGLVTALRTLGVILSREGRSKDAVKMLQRSIEIAQSISEPEEACDSYHELAAIYARNQDYEKALDAYKTYHALYDTLLNLEKSKALNRLKTLYETEKKEQEILRLQQENKLQELELSREMLLRNSFLIVSVLAVVLLGVAYRAYHITQKSEQALREKNIALAEALQTAEEQRRIAEVQRQVAEQQRRIAEEQRQIAEEQRRIAEEASRIKTELLSIAAHDLKNPLQSISGFAELSLEQLPSLATVVQDQNAKLRTIETFLEKIYASSQRMTELISSLLETAALEAGKISLNLQHHDVSALMQAVVDESEVRAQQKSQRLYAELAPNCYAAIDPSRMREVFENLVSNAIKYSPEGKSIWVSVKCQPLTTLPPAVMQSFTTHTNGVSDSAPSQQSVILIAVKDEGQGLTEDDMRRVFGKFQRLSARPTGGESSTGLGLSIVKSLVELHGGKVWVESAGKDKGATFFVALPASGM